LDLQAQVDPQVNEEEEECQVLQVKLEPLDQLEKLERKDLWVPKDHLDLKVIEARKDKRDIKEILA